MVPAWQPRHGNVASEDVLILSDPTDLFQSRACETLLIVAGSYLRVFLQAACCFGSIELKMLHGFHCSYSALSPLPPSARLTGDRLRLRPFRSALLAFPVLSQQRKRPDQCAVTVVCASAACVANTSQASGLGLLFSLVPVK